MPRSTTVLVTGATGLQGGAVARLLLDRGHRVRALTRRPASQAAATLHVLGADVYEGDLDDGLSVRSAARGANAIFLVTTPFEEGVEAEVRQAESAIRAAEQAGITQIVYSSIAGADRAGGIACVDAKRRIEDFVRRWRGTWTIVAPTFFMENLLRPQLRAGMEAGQLRLPVAPTRPLQMVALGDLAGVVRLALERPGELGARRIELASDRLTGPEMAATLTTVTNRAVDYLEAPSDDARAQGDGIALLWQWLSRAGDIDLEALREAYPEVDWQDFGRWAREREWSGVGRYSQQRPMT